MTWNSLKLPKLPLKQTMIFQLCRLSQSRKKKIWFQTTGWRFSRLINLIYIIIHSSSQKSRLSWFPWPQSQVGAAIPPKTEPGCKGTCRNAPHSGGVTSAGLSATGCYLSTNRGTWSNAPHSDQQTEELEVTLHVLRGWLLQDFLPLAAACQQTEELEVTLHVLINKQRNLK